MSEIRTDTINNASGDNDSGIDLYTNDQVSIKTANTTAVTVDANQNVGIGTSSPSGAAGTTLAINGSSGQSRLALKNTSTGDASGDGFQLSVGTDGSVGIEQRENNYMALYTNATERMRIDASGNLLMGTTSVFSGSGIVPLVTINKSAGSGLGINSIGSNEVGLATRPSATHNYYAGFFLNNAGTGIGNITVGTSSTAYNTSSDHRLKENVTADWDATTRLKQLNPVRFNFIADADTTVDGFLAHEVQSVVPEAISGTHNEVDNDGNPVYQGIDQSKLVPLLVKTIQELEARIEALENA